MKLKLLYRFILIVLLFGCQKQSNKDIIAFKEVLGERKTEALDLLVSDFENNLEKVYSDLSLQKAYEQYLKDLIDPKENNWDKFRFQSNETHIEFVNSGLKDEIYNIKLEYVEEKNDSILTHNVNQIGKYMQAIYHIKESDTLVNKYYHSREAGGIISNERFVNGTLYHKPNFNNYFHKIIVVLEYSY